MKFTYKSEADLQKMDESQRDDYAVNKREFEANSTKEMIEMANKDLVEKLKKADENLTELALKVKELETNNSFKTVKSLADELKENKDALIDIAKNVSSDELILKATTSRSSIATNPQVYLLDGIGQLARKKRSLYDIFRKIPVNGSNNNGTIAYIDWDEATTVKAAASVAEGVAFPQSTAKFKGYTLPIRKIGDSLPVTEEFFEDEEAAAAELDLFLETNVLEVVDQQLVTGDNTGENLKGLITSTPAYVPVAAGIPGANVYDLIIKVKESITATGGAKYTPDFVAMNIADINKMKLTKDTTENYVFNFNDPRVDSLMIVEDNHVTANTMYVGDSRFARIYEKNGVVVSKGFNGTNFGDDMMTIKARKRLAFLIRTVDQTGFKKVTDIDAALVTLAT